MPLFTVRQDRHALTVAAPELELTFSLDDGGIRALRRHDSPNVVGHGNPLPGVDIQLGAGWLAARTFVRYLGHTVDERDGGVQITIVIGIGALTVYDRYRITGTLIARRVSIQNAGEDEVRLRGVRLILPWVRLGHPQRCRFEAPGNSVRPRVPLPVAAAQRLDVLPRRFFTPEPHEGYAFEPTPTQGPGLLALHDPESNETLFCWFHSAISAALPQIDGNDNAVTLFHEIGLADRLRSEVALSSGTQYIMLVREPWPAALRAFQRTLPLCGVHRHADPPAWLFDAAIYETHPAHFGGFRGLAAALPGLRALGLNTLCLMPIWEFARRREGLWDSNWESSGNPYAIRDFETLDPTLGTIDELRALVAAAHRHGMRVLLDLPLYGCAGDSRYIRERPEWFCYDEQGQPAYLVDQSDVVGFDWTSQTLHDYIHTWALAQLRAYDLDGYRVMTSRTDLPSWINALSCHANPNGILVLKMLQRLRQAIREARGESVLIAEHGGPIYGVNHDLVLDELAHHMFVHMALGRITPAELANWLEDATAALPPGIIHACFTESHRTRIMNSLADGLRGSRISRMLLTGMVLCGFVPMIWFGQEHDEGRFIARLLQLRARCAALRYGASLYNSVPCSSPQVFTVLRMHEAERLIGLLNVGPHKQTVVLKVPVEHLGLSEGNYLLYEALAGDVWVEDGRHTWQRDELRSLQLTLEPFGAYCFAVQLAGQE